MNHVEKLISKFGSQSELARAIGVRQPSVQRWTQTGVIPQRRFLDIRRAAQERGIDLTPLDLLGNFR